jgi:hypothetical protein
VPAALGEAVHALDFPVYLWLGPLAIHPHWLFESLAYLVGAAITFLLSAACWAGLNPEGIGRFLQGRGLF